MSDAVRLGSLIILGFLGFIVATPMLSPYASDEQATDLGIEVRVKDIHWTIIEVADVTGDLGNVVAHNGKLIGVRYKVKNLTDTLLTSQGLELTDDVDNKYSYLSDALSYIEDVEACETETIEPNTAKLCTSIYDVPNDVTGLRIVVTDLNMLGGKTQEIPLPMN